MLANFRRIRALEDAEADPAASAEDYLYFVKAANKKQQIIDLSVRHQIASKYTAFLCVEKHLVDGKYQEIQDKGTEQVQIVERALPPPPESNMFDFNSSFGQPCVPPPPGASLFYAPPPPPSLCIPHQPMSMPTASSNQPNFINFFGSSQQPATSLPAPLMPPPLPRAPNQQADLFSSTTSTTTNKNMKIFDHLFNLGDIGGSPWPISNDNQLFKKKTEETTVQQPAKQVAKRSLFDDD